MCLIRLIGELCPTYERFHTLATPTLAFALELLSASRIVSVVECARALALCALLAHWIRGSRRYLPEVMAHLRGALMLSTETGGGADAAVFPTMSFPIAVPHSEMLYVKKKVLIIESMII